MISPLLKEKSEKDSENQYETIPSSSLPAIETTDFEEETDTDNQTIEMDSFEEGSGTDTVHSQRNAPKPKALINGAGSNLHCHHQSSYLTTHSTNAHKTLDSSLDTEEIQDTSVISAQNSSSYDDMMLRNDKKSQQECDNLGNHRNNNKHMNNNIRRSGDNSSMIGPISNITDRASLQGYIFRKRLLMTEADETIL